MSEHRVESPSRIHITTVETSYLDGKHNHRVLFGEPLRIDTRHAAEGMTQKVYSFSAGSRFALDLWRRNAYGTIQWRCMVCEAVSPGMEIDRVPFVAPGARVLLHTQGAAQSRLFLAWLADLETTGIDVLRCAPETYEAAHFRLHGCRADTTPPRRLSNRL